MRQVGGDRVGGFLEAGEPLLHVLAHEAQDLRRPLRVRARDDVDQRQRLKRARRDHRLGHQPGDAAERGANQRRRRVERGGDVDQVLADRERLIVAFGVPVAVAMAAQVERDGAPAQLGQALSRRAPGVPRLSAAVREDDRAALAGAQHVGRELEAGAGLERGLGQGGLGKVGGRSVISTRAGRAKPAPTSGGQLEDLDDVGGARDRAGVRADAAVVHGRLADGLRTAPARCRPRRGGWAGQGCAPGRARRRRRSRPGGPSARATSAWRSAFTLAFQASTAGSMTQEVIPCGTPKPPPSVWPMAWLAPSPRPALGAADRQPHAELAIEPRVEVVGRFLRGGEAGGEAFQPALCESVGVGRALGIAELLDRMVDGLQTGREPELRAASRASAAGRARPRAAPSIGWP